jgi:hypothetical protein
VCLQTAHGSCLQNGLLFCEKTHTLRLTLGGDGRAQNVRFIRTIKGRTDVVLYDGTAVHVARDTALVAIEIKPTEKFDSGRKEAIVQLIGLNIANLRHAPSVILTDLAKKHECYWLVGPDAAALPEAHLHYELRFKRFEQFNEALSFALHEHLGFDARSSCDFGRGLTPPASVAETDET